MRVFCILLKNILWLILNFWDIVIECNLLIVGLLMREFYLYIKIFIIDFFKSFFIEFIVLL